MDAPTTTPRVCDIGISRGELATLRALAAHVERTGRSPSAAEVAAATGQGRRTVACQISHLFRRDLLTIAGRRGSGLAYRPAADALRRVAVMPTFPRGGGSHRAINPLAILDAARALVEDEVYPSTRLVAEALGLTGGGIRRHVKRLKAAGLWPDHSIPPTQRIAEAARLRGLRHRKRVAASLARDRAADGRHRPRVGRTAGRPPAA